MYQRYTRRRHRSEIGSAFCFVIIIIFYKTENIASNAPLYPAERENANRTAECGGVKAFSETSADVPVDGQRQMMMMHCAYNWLPHDLRTAVLCHTHTHSHTRSLEIESQFAIFAKNALAFVLIHIYFRLFRCFSETPSSATKIDAIDRCIERVSRSFRNGENEWILNPQTG